MKRSYTIRNFILATRTGKAVFMALAAIMAATTIAYAVQGRRGPKVTSITVAPATPAGLAGTTGKSIGDSYGGGIIAYILQNATESIGYIDANGNAQTQAYDPKVQHGLIAATADETSEMAWIVGGSLQTSFLSGNAVSTGTGLGDGAANTVKILAANPTGGAGKVCADKEDGEYSDWYLPSLGELVKLYTNRGKIGGFSLACYWSSSESDWNGGVNQNDRAWAYYFQGWEESNEFKNASRRVRAVRAF